MSLDPSFVRENSIRQQCRNRLPKSQYRWPLFSAINRPPFLLGGGDVIRFRALVPASLLVFSLMAQTPQWRANQEKLEEKFAARRIENLKQRISRGDVSAAYELGVS